MSSLWSSIFTENSAPVTTNIYLKEYSPTKHYTPFTLLEIAFFLNFKIDAAELDILPVLCIIPCQNLPKIQHANSSSWHYAVLA